MKIGLCGTMSVGKTTLVKALSELPQFKDYHVATERSKYLRDLGIPLNTDSTVNGQIIFLAERSAELLCENVLTDRINPKNSSKIIFFIISYFFYFAQIPLLSFLHQTTPP
jgi:deoxyadenosine/deoxycytidine kinase